jgi:FKBP-type peptidyl-prolyl cis-trans isomerase
MIDIKETEYPGDIYEGLLLMHEGDSATLVMSSDSFFIRTAGSIRPFFLDSASFFYLDLKIEKLRTEQEYQTELKAENEKRREMERQELAAFIQENAITATPAESGLLYVENKAGKGKIPAAGNILKLHYSVKLITGRVLFDSKAEGEPMVHQMGSGRSGRGFDEGLEKMREGGEAMFVVPSNIAFGEEGGGAIPPFATLIFNVELLNVYTEEDYQKQQLKEASTMETKELKTLAEYIKTNKISVKPQSSGLYYVEVSAGKGTRATSGRKVKVHYDGKLLNGERFDSSYERGTPFEFTLGQGQVIPGWDEGIALMKVGGKAKLIIPSKLGYGVQGSGKKIPPYSTLVFDVELLGVE